MRLRVLAEEILAAHGRSGLQLEAFDVGESLLVGIVEGHAPHLVGVEFLNAQEVGLVVIVHVEVSCVVFSVLEQNEDAVVRLELAEELAALVVVEARDVVVEPHVAAAER